jgi:hypothetical protein
VKLFLWSLYRRNVGNRQKSKTEIQIWKSKKKMIERNLDSAYLQKQDDALTGAYELLQTVDRGCHLTSLQQLVMSQESQVIEEMAQAHRRAIAPVLAYENQE